MRGNYYMQAIEQVFDKEVSLDPLDLSLPHLQGREEVHLQGREEIVIYHIVKGREEVHLKGIEVGH